MNLKELKEILQILEEKEIAEFELEEEGMRLRIRKAAAASSNHSEPPVPASPPVPPPTPAQASAAAPAPAAAPPAPEARSEEEADLEVVKSPIVGTFYRGPDPASPPFVNVGDHVRVGQLLCIIEAMKLMNEIEAEVAGEVVAIHHDNGQPVQYGDALFGIRKDRS